MDVLAPRIREWGFDLIELPLENPRDWDPARTAALLRRLGLGATICAVMSPSRDLLSGDRQVVASTQAYLRDCLDIARTVGSGVVAGPIYSSVGRTWFLDPAQRRATLAQLVEALRPVADFAGQRGVRLAIEPLNRFETSLFNTVEQTLDLVDRLRSPAVGLLLDTFHMNIEEKNPAQAVRLAGPHIAHVHACGNDRGAPGSDHIDWPSIASALRDARYDGALCIESFTGENQTIARAASIWRPLARTQDAIATDGLAFLRGLMGTPPRGPRQEAP
jgi:D-psicose/D-tagatose/L-ribulose 3-epimerase